MTYEAAMRKCSSEWYRERNLVLVCDTTQGKIWERMDLLPANWQWQRVVNDVALSHNLPASQIAGRRRFKALARARAECYWRIRNEIRMSDGRKPSWPLIGKWMRRDHSTCLQMARKHAASQARSS